MITLDQTYMDKLLAVEKSIDGVMYPYRSGDYKSLLERAFNIVNVLENIQFVTPTLVHHTSRKKTLVRGR